MQMKSFTSYATLAALVAAMACAGNTAKTEDADQSAAARDTTTTGQDTLTGQTENPSGYRGMETDTTQAQPGQTPSDTFLQNQGQGTPQDTAGYTGMERVDTTGQAGQTTTGGDTTGVTGGQDTSGMTGADTSTSSQSGTQLDSTGTSQTGDTTGYDQSQQGQDSTSR